LLTLALFLLAAQPSTCGRALSLLDQPRQELKEVTKEDSVATSKATGQLGKAAGHAKKKAQ